MAGGPHTKRGDKKKINSHAKRQKSNNTSPTYGKKGKMQQIKVKCKSNCIQTLHPKCINKNSM
jgi:hypothetical protein